MRHGRALPAGVWALGCPVLGDIEGSSQGLSCSWDVCFQGAFWRKCTHAHTHAGSHMHDMSAAHARMLTHAHTCTHVYSHVYTLTYTCIHCHTCMLTCTRVLTHTHTLATSTCVSLQKRSHVCCHLRESTARWQAVRAPDPCCGPQVLADAVARLVLDKFADLTDNFSSPHARRKVLAGIVMTTGTQLEL